VFGLRPSPAILGATSSSRHFAREQSRNGRTFTMVEHYVDDLVKMLFQELCLAKTSWDEKVDEKMCATINNLRSDLAFLNEVPIPRCYFLPNLKPAIVQIHGFSDASERAFAAVIYLRTLYENGTIDVNLIASKALWLPPRNKPYRDSSY
jgi:hypothetical protein